MREIFRGLSLLLCLAMIALWSRSLVGDDRIGYWFLSANHKLDMYCLHSGAGSIGIFLCKDGDGYGSAPDRGFTVALAPNTTHGVPPGVLGFVYRHGSSTVVGGAPTISGVYTYAMVPYLLLIVLSALAPVNALIRARRTAQRLKLGQCRHCGYDLRGSMPRCPECGQRVLDDPSIASRDKQVIESDTD
jgi:hypothetical protein